MAILLLKLINNVRKAVAGRRYPGQLAGGVALGVLLGIIPHGNLLAVFVLCGVLCFRVNHAMTALIAVAVSFGAASLDPYSHQVGHFLLTHPEGNEIATRLWQLPLVPWTDLNNTVVAGSFAIGLASVLPIFFLTWPLFRLIAPNDEESDADFDVTDSRSADARGDAAHDGPDPHHRDDEEKGKRVAIVDGEESTPERPQFLNRESDVPKNKPATIPIDTVLASEPDFQPVEGVDNPDALPTTDEMLAVETRLDVIRLTDFVDEGDSEDSSSDEPEQPMDEALSYLLGQLRNSQQRKAAG